MGIAVENKSDTGPGPAISHYCDIAMKIKYMRAINEIKLFAVYKYYYRWNIARKGGPSSG